MTHLAMPARDPESRTSSPPEFWVVGGEYRDTDFAELNGPAEAIGPFPSYDHAYQEWERRSMEMKHIGLMRYTVVGNMTRG